MSKHHEHEPANLSTHNHHRRSVWRNRSLALFELPLAFISGSFALKVAVGHNGVDGSVHRLREQASNETDRHARAILRFKAAALLGAAGLASFALERLTGTHGNIPSWVGWVFVGETAVNAIGLADGVHSNERGTDTITSILHNSTDAIISAATAATILVPKYLGQNNTNLLDTAAGYGHLGLLGVVAAATAATAHRD